ncbi:hypothetical protein QYF36_019659 [Acer negundo]|nr:hypothetical protein QYF36_019659 [Acer negundo]
MSRKDPIVSVEPPERKAARKLRSGETSRGNDAQLTEEEGENVSIVIHQIAGSKITAELEKKFKSMDEAMKEAEDPKPKIQKIPFMLRGNDNFILHYIICAHYQKPEDRNQGNQQTPEDQYEKLKELKIKMDHIMFVQHDLFLLDNQLPYELLDLLMKWSNKHKDLQDSMKNFILDSINAPTELNKANQQNYLVDYKPLHLLDLLRTTLIQPVVQETGCFRERLRKILKGFLGEKVFDKLTCKKELIWDSSFRNIEELKAAGISLKPTILALASSIVQTVYTVQGYYKPDNPPIIYLA